MGRRLRERQVRAQLSVISRVDREDYESPGRPFRYPAEPRPLNDEERAFFARMDGEYWRPAAPGHLGTVSRLPHGSLTRSELERLCNLILGCRLMTKIGAGVFGLSGYSMTVYDVPAPQGMINDEPPKRLFTLTSDHVPGRRESGDTRRQDQKDWIFFTGFTHSPENLAMIDFHKVARPRQRTEYDY